MRIGVRRCDELARPVEEFVQVLARPRTQIGVVRGIAGSRVADASVLPIHAA